MPEECQSVACLRRARGDDTIVGVGERVLVTNADDTITMYHPECYTLRRNPTPEPQEPQPQEPQPPQEPQAPASPPA